jgi:hypothetical protein
LANLLGDAGCCRRKPVAFRGDHIDDLPAAGKQRFQLGTATRAQLDKYARLFKQAGIKAE